MLIKNIINSILPEWLQEDLVLPDYMEWWLALSPEKKLKYYIRFLKEKDISQDLEYKLSENDIEEIYAFKEENYKIFSYSEDEMRTTQEEITAMSKKIKNGKRYLTEWQEDMDTKDREATAKLIKAMELYLLALTIRLNAMKEFNIL